MNQVIIFINDFFVKVDMISTPREIIKIEEKKIQFDNDDGVY